MKTRLVVLIDFSPQTDTILKLAKHWNEIMKAEILLIHQITYAVPPFYEIRFPQTLTVAVTHKFPTNRIAFNNLLKTVQNFIELVHFVSIVTLEESAKKSHEYLLNLTRECEYNIPCTYDIFEGKSAFEEIKKFVSDNPNTILVVQKGSHTITDNLFRKFMINDLVHDNSLPLIVVPN